MTTYPVLPLYIDDYEAATAHLTPEEDGIYGRLLRLAWRTPGCSLPVDPAWLTRKLRITPEGFEQVAKVVLDEFFDVSRGRYTQARLKREYDEVSRRKSARQNAGKSGGLAKSAKYHDNDPSNATVLLPDTRAFPSPSPSPSPLPLNGVDERESENVVPLSSRMRKNSAEEFS